jgi:hypothetical protein
MRTCAHKVVVLPNLKWFSRGSFGLLLQQADLLLDLPYPVPWSPLMTSTTAKLRFANLVLASLPKDGQASNQMHQVVFQEGVFPF